MPRSNYGDINCKDSNPHEEHKTTTLPSFNPAAQNSSSDPVTPSEETSAQDPDDQATEVASRRLVVTNDKRLSFYRVDQNGQR